MSLDAALRARLGEIADALIPAAGRMPAASEVGVAGPQLDVVLASRPDLEPGLRRALELAAEPAEILAWMDALREQDGEAYGALVTTVVGAYYLEPGVQRRLGYPGQVPEPVTPELLPPYADELERVVARGPIFRPTPPR